MFKKIVLIFAVLLSLLISCGKIAYADTGEWARIVLDDVYLYATEDTKKQLFVLEKSYYVSIIDETEDMYEVAVMPENNKEFVRITGWVRKSDVSKCSAPVEPCYPTVKIAVKGNSADLMPTPDPSAQPSFTIANPQQMCYYGKIVSYGKTWYYVRFAGSNGYVEASSVTNPDIQLHPTPLPQTPANTVPTTPSTDTTPDPTQESKLPASEILLIVFIVVLAVGLTLALFLPGNFKRKNTVFEQDI